jgi:hypothetical protein
MPAAPGANAAVPPAALPPAVVNAPVVPAVEPAPSVARVLVQRGWEAAGRNGDFYYPSADFPRIHIVLAADATPFDPLVNLYKDVKTVEVQDTTPGRGILTYTFWLNDVKQRDDNVRLKAAYALLAAQSRTILNDVLAEH